MDTLDTSQPVPAKATRVMPRTLGTGGLLILSIGTFTLGVDGFVLSGRVLAALGAARARCVPQLLWPGWAVRLMPAEGLAAVPFRPAIATCLLLPSKQTRAIHPGDGPHAHRSSVAINSILRSLTAAGHDSVLTAAAASPGGPGDYRPGCADRAESVRRAPPPGPDRPRRRERGQTRR